MFEDNFLETTVETKLTWFIHDMVSYEIDLSIIENIIKVISLMYCVSDDKISQILLLAKSKCEERNEYGQSNQLGASSALNELSETESMLIEQDIKNSNEEAKLKLEEEKNIQGDRKNTIDCEENKTYDYGKLKFINVKWLCATLDHQLQIGDHKLFNKI